MNRRNGRGKILDTMPALAERVAVARTVAWSEFVAQLGRVIGDRSNASSKRVGANNA